MQNMGDMQGLISQLAQAELSEQDMENLKKQIRRHQIPIVFQVNALIELIKYQKSIIPQHLVEPLVDSVKTYIMKELENI